MNLSMKNRCCVFSDFLDPQEAQLCQSLLLDYPDLEISSNGGFPGAERVLVAIFPKYIQFDHRDLPITAIRITRKAANIMGELFEHRSILGSLMALGIKREKIGDIIIFGAVADVVLCKETGEYITLFLEKIGTSRVECNEISLKELMTPQEKFFMIKDTVSSLRLDALLALCMKKSRNAVCEYIKSGKVKVNHCETLDISKNLKENDLISIKGFGRVLFESIEGTTKKGKLTIRLKKYL